MMISKWTSTVASESKARIHTRSESTMDNNKEGVCVDP